MNNFTKQCFKSQKLYLFLSSILFPLILGSVGCCPYSFTGASTPEHIRTVAIPIIDDRSGSGEPGLREDFTNRLTQRFIDDNTLQVTDRQRANSVLECTIVSLVDAPAVVTSGERIEQRKVTLSVRVVFKDLVKRRNVYERTFSNFGYYPPGGNINQRKQALDEALERISEDILLDTVSGW